MSFEKTSLVRQLIPKSFHFDGYNEVNCPNSRDRPFFCDNTINIGSYDLSIRMLNEKTLSLEFASVCKIGHITFKPYIITIEEYVSKLKEALNTNSDFISFEITPVYDKSLYSCYGCNLKNNDCIQIRKTHPRTILAAVSFNMSDVSDALAMYYEITNKTNGGNNNMRKKNNFFGMNFEFGVSKDPNIASTIMGVAVKDKETGNWYTFDSATNTRKNIASLKMGDFPIFLLPDKNLAVGDLIKHNGKYVYVKAVNPAANTFSVINATDGFVNEIVPEETLIPGLNFYTKVVAFDMKNMSNAANGNNISSNLLAAMCMMQWSKGETADFSLDSINDDSFNGLGSCLPALMMLNNGGTNMFSGANGSFGLLEAMALGGGMEGNDGMQMLVLSQLLGGNNAASPFANILPSSVAPATSGASVVCEKCGASYSEGTNFCSKCGGKTKVAGKTCAACGTTLKENATFCHKCGANAAAVTCPGCGATVEGADAFCSKCGANLKAPKEKLCVSCKSVLEADDVFCPKCGQNQKAVITNIPPVEATATAEAEDPESK